MMRKFLLIFLFFPIVAYSQTDKIVDDVYGDQPILRIPDSLKESYFKKTFKEGQIILLNNTVLRGLIKFNGNLIYKESTDSKVEKYKSKEVKYFIVNGDTYITASVASYSMTNSSYAPSKSIQFLMESIKGKVSLYYRLIQSVSGTGYSATSHYTRYYYLKNNTDSEYYLIPSKKKAFIKLLSNILSDDVNLILEIENGSLKYDDIVGIIQRYNLSTL